MNIWKFPSQKRGRQIFYLRLYNISLFRSGRLLSYLDPQLEYAEYVSKTFEWQKKRQLIDTVTHMSSEDNTVCPVLLDSVLVQRVRGYLGSSDDNPMAAV